MIVAEANKSRLVWMDMEMTGLDPDKEAIIEIATIITDSELNVIATGPELVVHQDAARFETMDAWNQKQHKQSGLWPKVVASTITVADAEAQTLAFIKQHVPIHTSPLCGNSIWQDRRFLRRYMPKIDSYLHYRIVDVSTIKELAGRWYPNASAPKNKDNNHRALSDIIESIEELRYYRSNIFK